MSTTPRTRRTPAVPPKAAKTARSTRAAEAAPAAKQAAQPAHERRPKNADKASEAKPPKKAKPVLVRDGFTMPEADFSLIAALKKRAAAAGREAKKSELLRAGLRALTALDTSTLVAALNALEPVKVGRPRKGH